MQSQRAYPILAIVIGLGLLLYATFPHGIGLSEDSISYLSAARGLHNSGKMLDIDGSYFVAWAPLYPVIIAVLEILPFKIEYCLAGLNMLLFVLMVITSWMLIVRVIEKPFFRVACLFAIVLSFTVMQVYATALSESLFLVVVNVVVLVGTRDERRGTRALLALVCALALCTRYVGVFLLPVVLMMGARDAGRGTWRRVLVIAIAVVPLGIWLVRNWMLTDTLTGIRAAGGDRFWYNMVVLAETVTSWVLPIKVPLLIRMTALVLIVELIRRSLVQKINADHLLLVAMYLATLAVAYALLSFEEPRDRLLAPVFVSFFILLFSGLEKFSARFTTIPYPVVVGMVCLWMFYPASRIVKHVQRWHHSGVDVYNKPALDSSETIAWLKENSLSGRIVSNDAYAIYYFTGKNAFRVPKSVYREGRFAHPVNDGDLLVWWRRKEYYTQLHRFKDTYALEVETGFNDAVIFRMSRE